MSVSSGLRIFEGAVAIITGGASGIGAALGQELARRGGEVVLADVQMDLAQQVTANIVAKGGKASAIELDVTNSLAFSDLVQAVFNRTGRLDYLFNNAGIGVGGLAQDHALADWDRIIDVNLRGVVHGVQAAYPLMIQQGFGHIVNTASFAGLSVPVGMIGYTTTKHAVVGLSKALRIEAAVLGVRVSVLCPGLIRTPILVNMKTVGALAQMPRADLVRVMERLLPPQESPVFARKALNAVARNRAIILIPWWYHLLWWIDRLSPTLNLYICEQGFRIMNHELEKSYEASN